MWVRGSIDCPVNLGIIRLSMFMRKIMVSRGKDVRGRFMRVIRRGMGVMMIISGIRGDLRGVFE